MPFSPVHSIGVIYLNSVCTKSRLRGRALKKKLKRACPCVKYFFFPFSYLFPLFFQTRFGKPCGRRIPCDCLLALSEFCNLRKYFLEFQHKQDSMEIKKNSMGMEKGGVPMAPPPPPTRTEEEFRTPPLLSFQRGY